MRLKISELSKKYKNKVALNSVNLSASNGVYGLLGPNGAGKTTFMRILAGIINADGGKIIFDGEDILKNMENFRYKMGYLPQEFGSFKTISTKECLETIAILKGITNKNKREQQIEKILQEVNLDKESNKKVGALSGGMRRRLGIAQAMLGNPSIIMVDEPTAGLDPEERIRFRALIRRIASGRVVILSTHIMEDIRNNCDGLALIKNGTIEQFDNFKVLEDLAFGKVWQVTISPDRFEEIAAQHRILSTNTTEEGLDIRIFSDKLPLNGARQMQPTVEEGYLAWINA